MGATSVSFTVEGSKTEAEVRQAYIGRYNSDLSQYGNDPYNGSFSTTCGIKFETGKTFTSEHEALDYILENTNKRSHVLAVKAKRSRAELLKPVTFRGEPGASIGNTCWVRDFISNSFRVCDQATEAEACKLLNLLNARSELAGPASKAKFEFDKLVKELCDLGETFQKFTDLSKSRVAARKTKLAFDAADAKVNAYNDKLAERIWATKTVDLGESWLVGGWAAE